MFPELHVASAAGHVCTVSSAATSTVGELKAAIENCAGVPAATQRLFFGRRELVGGSSLGAVLPERMHGQELLLVRRSAEQARWLEEVEKDRTWDHRWFHDHAPAEARADREVVLAAAAKDYRHFELAAAELKADRDLS